MMLTRKDYGTNDNRYWNIYDLIRTRVNTYGIPKHRAYGEFITEFFTPTPKLPRGYRLEFQIENGSILCADCALHAWRQGYDVSCDVTTDDYEPCHECES